MILSQEQPKLSWSYCSRRQKLLSGQGLPQKMPFRAVFVSSSLTTIDRASE